VDWVTTDEEIVRTTVLIFYHVHTIMLPYSPTRGPHSQKAFGDLLPSMLHILSHCLQNGLYDESTCAFEIFNELIESVSLAGSVVSPLHMLLNVVSFMWCISPFPSWCHTSSC
jgi:hypothetical protein